MIVIACSNGKHIARKIASRLKAKYSELDVGRFPDNELHIKFKDCNLSGKTVVFVQTFHDALNDQLVEVVLAANTAKLYKAKKVVLAAPYFPYLRQDKVFSAGEIQSNKIIAGLFDKCIDEVLIVDPHLHRIKHLTDIFKIKAKELTADPLIAGFIHKKLKKPVLIGPDMESYQWAKTAAKMIGVDFAILEKTRYSSRKVSVKLNKKIELRNKNAVIVDDIISTGHTLLETIKELRKLGSKKITCIGVHGVFAEGAYEKLMRAKVHVVTCNTIQHKSNKIDVSGLIAENI